MRADEEMAIKPITAFFFLFLKDFSLCHGCIRIKGRHFSPNAIKSEPLDWGHNNGIEFEMFCKWLYIA